ncbi:MAG: hypothetical protein QNI89_02555 [Desulfobacterales bacterium]|nr:hypothetical protein [Desulfobacterales bacterium]MDJ0886149.1 hypothetical protein [Desulfobacterales bacterium]
MRSYYSLAIWLKNPIRRIAWLYLLLMICAAPMKLVADESDVALNSLPPGNRPIAVQARFFLSDINDINELAETFEIKGLLALQWQDERFVFDPKIEGLNKKRYQGSFQFLEEYNAWWPQLVLSNGVGTIPLQSVSLSISPDGTLLFLQEITAIVESPMDLRPYPFDKQKLKAIFEPLAYYGTEIRLVTGPEMVDLPERPVHVAGWELHGLSAAPHIEQDANSDALFTQFIVTLQVKRKPGFVIWFIIVPLSIIVLLSNSVFWINRELIGNRLDILFIGLLTIVAYQFVASESLPSVSYFTLINGFVYVGYLTIVASIVSNIWLYNLNERRSEVAAQRFNQLCRWVLPIAFLVFNLILFFYFYQF